MIHKKTFGEPAAVAPPKIHKSQIAKAKKNVFLQFHQLLRLLCFLILSSPYGLVSVCCRFK